MTLDDSDGRFAAIAGVVGLAVGVVLTFPLPLRLSSAVLEDGTYDAYQFLWNIWWVRESLLAQWTNPFFTSYLFHPEGVGLLFHTFSFSLGLVSLPLQIFLPGGVVTAHNLLVIAAPALTVVAVGLLAREVTGDPWAGLVSGLLAAVNPIAVWFLPVLYLNCSYLIGGLLWAWWRMQRRRRRADVALTLGLVAVLVFASQEYAMMALAVLVLDTTCRFLVPRLLGIPRGWGRGTLAFWGIAGAGLAALALATLEHPATPPPSWQARVWSSYVAGFVSPPWLVAPPHRFFTILYVGTAPLVLFAAALVWRTRGLRYWLTAVLLLSLMSLGPYLHLSYWLPENIPLSRPPPASGVPGPYLLATRFLPFLQFFRAPYRWVVALEIAMAVVAAFGVAGLRARIVGSGRRRALSGAIVGLVLVAGALDVRGLRAPLASAAIPSAYDILREDPEPAAVLELPSGPVVGSFAEFSSLHMYYQTAHGKFLIEGTVSRLPPGRHRVAERKITNFARLPWVKYVVIHYDLLKSAYPAGRRQVRHVERLLKTQGTLVSKSEKTAVYRLLTFQPESVGRPATGAPGMTLKKRPRQRGRR